MTTQEIRDRLREVEEQLEEVMPDDEISWHALSCAREILEDLLRQLDT